MITDLQSYSNYKKSYCCQRRILNSSFFVSAFKCIYNTVNTNYTMNQWSQSTSNIKNLIIWIFIMLPMYYYVAYVVPGMWQWDSPHLQVADLQGAPLTSGPRDNCSQCPPVNRHWWYQEQRLKISGLYDENCARAMRLKFMRHPHINDSELP